MTKDGLLIRYRLWLLLLLTGIAGAARFATLDRPPLWGDEAFTYYRVSGTFHQLLDIIQFNGFPPLHYEAYWELKQAHQLTPRVMRIIPATAGTLMVPAMYFLATQLVRRGVALLVALFTCCSAYMMVYSHDAKMYMTCWLFVALHMGCLLWWLRRGRSNIGRIAWLAWIATGIAAVGLHYSALLLLPLELIICLTYPLVDDGPAIWKRVLLYVFGLAIIAAGPVGYFVGFNRLGEKVDQQGFALGSETFWIQEYNAGRGVRDLALYTATAHLYSWEWPLNPEEPHIEPPYMLRGLMIFGVALLLFLGIGAMPWRATSKREPSGSAAGLLPWWLLYLWFGLWIVAIPCGLYCASVRRFASPTDALAALSQFIGHHWWALLGEIVMLALLCRVIRGFAVALAAAIPIVAALALFAAFLPATHASGTTWDARYWLDLVSWWRWMTDWRILLILLGVLPALAWHFSGDTYAVRFNRLALFVGVTLAIFGAALLVWQGFEHHINDLVKKTLGQPRYVLIDADRISRGMALPCDPAQCAAEPIRASANGAVTRAVDRAAARDEVWLTWLSLWMPRYLGIVWPAVAIAACALLMRLPTRPLRSLAIVLLLGVNVAQACGRMLATTEPPAGRVVADILAGQGPPSHTRTHVLNMAEAKVPSPGSLSILGPQFRYYYSLETGRSVVPRDFKFTALSDLPQMTRLWGIQIHADPRLSTILDAARQAGVNRLIVWEELPIDAKNKDGALPELTKGLGPSWRLSTQDYRGHDHWTWTHLWLLRRYEFVRTPR